MALRLRADPVEDRGDLGDLGQQDSEDGVCRCMMCFGNEAVALGLRGA